VKGISQVKRICPDDAFPVLVEHPPGTGHFCCTTGVRPEPKRRRKRVTTEEPKIPQRFESTIVAPRAETGSHGGFSDSPIVGLYG
jgi:hypothetical protein